MMKENINKSKQHTTLSSVYYQQKCIMEALTRVERRADKVDKASHQLWQHVYDLETKNNEVRKLIASLANSAHKSYEIPSPDTNVNLLSNFANKAYLTKPPIITTYLLTNITTSCTPLT